VGSELPTEYGSENLGIFALRGAFLSKARIMS